MVKTLMRVLLLFLFFLVWTTNSFAAIPQTERDALIALYNATNGDSWTDNTNWRLPGDSSQFNDPGTENTWFGVTLTLDNAHVESVSLEANNLTGSLPTELNDLTYLKTLNLKSNLISGSIPSMNALSLLETFNLSRNSLSGTLPSWLNTLTNLTTIDLEVNSLTGPLPDLSTCTQLSVLKLSFNPLALAFPTWLTNLTNLTVFEMKDNQMTGTLPNLGSMTQLSVFDVLSNSLTGTFPSWVTSLTNLTSFSLNNNQFTGTVPDLNTLTLLQVLDLSSNSFTGPLPDVSGSSSLLGVAFSRNQFTGNIPSWITGSSTLQYLHLNNNQLSGDLPSLSSMSALKYIDLSSNQFTGPLPSELANLPMEQIILRKNFFTGTIPAAYGNISTLTVLNLSGNNLNGEIPTEIRYLSNLEDTPISPGLDISWNALHTTDTLLINYLNSNHTYGNFWETSQTIAPTNVVAGDMNFANEVVLSWTPVDLQQSGAYRIYMSTTSGSDYILEAELTDKSLGQYTVSGLDPATTYYFIIKTVTYAHSDNPGEVVSEPCDEVFSQATATLTMVSPNGGETYDMNYPYQIQWDTVGTVENVFLYLSIDNGSSWEPIAGPIANTGYYDWTAPRIESDQCLIKVTSDSLPIEDTSDCVFTISPPTLTLTTPMGGDILNMNYPYQIQWTSSGWVENVFLYFSSDNGSSWEPIAGPIANTGNYDWTAPNIDSTQCFIRVTHDALPVDDMNDTAFSIIPPTLTVTSPSGGDTLNMNYPYQIQWTSTGWVENVFLQFSSDGGSSWENIAGPIPNTGSYDWTVPLIDSNQCLIRVSHEMLPVEDVTDSFFTILPPTLTLTLPAGGSNLNMGFPYQIQWTSTGWVENVFLQFSGDGGSTWENIAGPIPNIGYYDWIAPYFDSNQCLIRVSHEMLPVEDTNDSFFTILPPTIIVTLPTGGESLNMNFPYQIQWSTSGLVENVFINFSADNGSTWETIAGPIPNTGYYDWTVPLIDSN